MYTATSEQQAEGKAVYNGINLFKLYSAGSARWRAYRCVYNRRAVKQFKVLLKEFNPSVIHFHNIHNQLSYALFKPARAHTNRVFLSTHDVMLFAYDKINYFTRRPKLSNGDYNYQLPFLYNMRYARWRFNPLRNIIISRAIRNITKILCVSDELRKALEQNGVLNIETVHNSIDAGEWESSESKIREIRDAYGLDGKEVVLFVSRLTGNKGGYAVLDAMEHIVREVPEALLLIVGAQSNPQAVMDHPQIRDHVVFTGRIPYADIKHIYHASDVVVIPSVYLDPFPTINLEAMACSRPVVGTCFGGTREIVQDGITGYVANPLDTQVYADRIIDLLRDSDKARTMGAAGNNRVVTEFDLRTQIDAFESWYNQG